MDCREQTSRSFPLFFFSSRRRHTRFDCDWSSDVCSSDLLTEPFGFPAVKLIRDMSPGDLRSSFVFYIGAGAVASAGIIALARSLPTIMSSFASSLKEDRKSTRLNSSHSQISYAVFCLKKKKNKPKQNHTT